MSTLEETFHYGMKGYNNLETNSAILNIGQNKSTRYYRNLCVREAIYGNNEEEIELGCLTFTSQQAGSTITFRYASGTNVKYRINNGSWLGCESGTTTSALAVGDTVQYIGTNVQSGRSDHFLMTGKLAGSGSVTSLTDRTGKDPNVTLSSYCYSSMFSGCTSLTKAPSLPATTLDSGCYSLMFSGCTSLTKAPSLPATTLNYYCYSSMFSGCTSLTKAPSLPATTLDSHCYSSMFYGCTSLTKAPSLPATTLDSGCYSSMFSGCTSLTKAPSLPATTLNSYCYSSMFSGCTSLTNAPSLPATTLNSYCYSSMFSGCTSLTNAPSLPVTTLDSGCYSSMFYGCTSLTKAPSLPATTLNSYCYSSMFSGCTKLKINNNSVTGGHIFLNLPTGTKSATSWNTNMFTNTGGSFTENPSIGTAYYCYS